MGAALEQLEVGQVRRDEVESGAAGREERAQVAALLHQHPPDQEEHRAPLDRVEAGLELLSLVAKMPRASLEAVVLDMVATGHPINEGELEVAATEDEACLGACAVAPAPQVPQGLEYEAGVLSGLERDTVEQLVLRGVAGGDPPTKADIRACEKRRLSRADSMSGDESCCPPRCCCC